MSTFTQLQLGASSAHPAADGMDDPARRLCWKALLPAASKWGGGKKSPLRLFTTWEIDCFTTSYGKLYGYSLFIFDFLYYFLLQALAEINVRIMCRKGNGTCYKECVIQKR